MTSHIAKTTDVIIDCESKDEGFTHEGRAFLDAPEIDGTVFIQNGGCEIGEIVKVKIIEAWEYDLVGITEPEIK